jgi:Trk-type K+ transport system membrane component
MTKMIRLAKFGKIRTKLFKNFSGIMELTAGLDRLLFLSMLFFLMIHIIACFWIFIAKFDEFSKENWIYSKGYQDLSVYDLYVASFYFSVTTIVTVGYGDITAISSGEKLIAVFLMVIGVIAFSFATGALGNILANIDSSEAKLKEKMTTLNDINNKYNLDKKLYQKLY